MGYRVGQRVSCKELDTIEQQNMQAVIILVGGAIIDDDIAKTICQVVLRVLMHQLIQFLHNPEQAVLVVIPI